MFLKNRTSLTFLVLLPLFVVITLDALYLKRPYSLGTTDSIESYVSFAWGILSGHGFQSVHHPGYLNQGVLALFLKIFTSLFGFPNSLAPIIYFCIFFNLFILALAGAWVARSISQIELKSKVKLPWIAFCVGLTWISYLPNITFFRNWSPHWLSFFLIFPAILHLILKQKPWPGILVLGAVLGNYFPAITILGVFLPLYFWKNIRRISKTGENFSLVGFKHLALLFGVFFVGYAIGSCGQIELWWQDFFKFLPSRFLTLDPNQTPLEHFDPRDFFARYPWGWQVWLSLSMASFVALFVKKIRWIVLCFLLLAFFQVYASGHLALIPFWHGRNNNYYQYGLIPRMLSVWAVIPGILVAIIAHIKNPFKYQKRVVTLLATIILYTSFSQTIDYFSKYAPISKEFSQITTNQKVFFSSTHFSPYLKLNQKNILFCIDTNQIPECAIGYSYFKARFRPQKSVIALLKKDNFPYEQVAEDVYCEKFKESLTSGHYKVCFSNRIGNVANYVNTFYNQSNNFNIVIASDRFNNRLNPIEQRWLDIEDTGFHLALFNKL